PHPLLPTAYHLNSSRPRPRAGSLLDRRADKISPFRPGAVVVGDVAVAQQILQYKPAMAGALADAAVGDDRLAAVHAFGSVETFQVVERLERTVIVASFAPGDVARSGDMPAALASLRQTRRSKNLAGEFLWTADIHQHRASLAAGCLR